MESDRSEKRISRLIRNDGRFPPGADRERASYIYTIRKTVSASRTGDPCVKGYIAYLQAQYGIMEDLNWRFDQAHGNLMGKLTDAKYETEEHEVFDTICRDAAAELTILRRAIRTRERIENPMPKPEKVTAPSKTIEPGSEIEELIAQNAVLMHRLGVGRRESPKPTTVTSQTARLGTSRETAISVPVSSPKGKPKTQQHGRVTKRNDLRNTNNKRQLKSAVVKATQPKKSQTELACYHCFGSHKIFKCEEFKKLTLCGRLELDDRLRLCTICLMFKEQNHRCKNGQTECRLCAPTAHNSSLCPRRVISE